MRWPVWRGFQTVGHAVSIFTNFNHWSKSAFVENKFTQLLTGFKFVDIFLIYDLYDLVYHYSSQSFTI